GGRGSRAERGLVSQRGAGVDGGIAFEGGATVSVLNVVLPLGSSVLSFVFAAMVLDQWWQRRHSFQLVWGIGLLWYGISAGTEFLGGAFVPVPRVHVGSAFPGYVRVRTGPFNIAGALCLVFGAIYSAYVYMPKHKVLRATVRMPVIAQLYGVAAVTVNFVASLPAAA